MALLEINRNYIIWYIMYPPGMYESYFVTGTYPNIKCGCHHHQIGMDYLYDVIFKMAANEVKLRFHLLLCVQDRQRQHFGF